MNNHSITLVHKSLRYKINPLFSVLLVLCCSKLWSSLWRQCEASPLLRGRDAQHGRTWKAKVHPTQITPSHGSNHFLDPAVCLQPLNPSNINSFDYCQGKKKSLSFFNLSWNYTKGRTMAEADLGRLDCLRMFFFCSFHQIIEVTARKRHCSVKKGQAGKG